LESELLLAPAMPNEDFSSFNVLEEFIISYKSCLGMTLTVKEYIFSSANVSERVTSMR
jgi:hypothetical protein